MPIGESTEPAGGRVTRSLRKRLTSIDSDVPSRPGTPNNINLQTIPETNTPTKRLTRRASLNTPATGTPSKGKNLIESVESSNTPGRRITRRRSVNISDSEDHAVQPIIKGPTVAVVKEEEPDIESPKEKPKRVLRSSSKSPNDTESTKKNKNASKKIIKLEVEEPEIINLDDSVEIENLKAQSTKKKTRVSIKKEILVETEKDKSNSANESMPTEQATDLSITKDKKRSSNAGNGTPVKSPSKRESLQNQNTPEKPKSHTGSAKKNKSAQKEKSTSDSKSSPKASEEIEGIKEKETSATKTDSTNIAAIAEEMGFRRLSLTTKNKSSPSPKAQSAKKSPQKKNHPEPLKSVAFNESNDESSEKSVYPKTPGLVKSKSYILDASNDVDKDDTFKSKKDNSHKENTTKSAKESSDEDDDEEENEETAVISTKTPYKLKLKSVESSTPIQISSPKQNKTSENRKEQSIKEVVFSEDEEDEDKEKVTVGFPKSWTQSVSGTVRETSKIDCIISETSLTKKQAEEAARRSVSNTSHNSSQNKSQNSSKNKSLQYVSKPNISDAEDDMLEEDDDEFNEDDDEEERIAEKTVFIDDEAMEVAEGEESMDSEEKAYLEENEIPEYGESIGSQDSEEDDGGDEDPDEEDAAFVVSDSEVIEELLSSADELETAKSRKYKRIVQASETSEEEREDTDKKDDTDFCLLVDSSYEVENVKKLSEDKSAELKNISVKEKSLKESSKLDNSKLNQTIEKDIIEKKNEKEVEKCTGESPNQQKKDESRKTVDTNYDENKEQSKLDSSKYIQTAQDIDSDISMAEADEEFTTKGKVEILQNITIASPSVNKKLTKSPKRKSSVTAACDETENESAKDSGKSMDKNVACDNGLKSAEKKKLTKSPKRKSSETFDESDDKNKKDSRKSLNDDETEKPLHQLSKSVENVNKLNDSSRKSFNKIGISVYESKSPSKIKSKKIITSSDEDSDEDLDHLTKKSNISKRKSSTVVDQENKTDFTKVSRMSMNKSIAPADDDDDDDSADSPTNDKSLNQSIKSINKSIEKSEHKENLNASQRKSITNKNVSATEEKDNSKSRKSMNESRKSLIRTSTEEEANETEEQYTLEKTKLTLGEASEPEETLSASENPLDTSAGKGLNTSKKSRKSIDLNNKSSQNDKSAGKPQRRKSMAQQSLAQEVSESSADSEQENKEISRRRKSIVEQIIAQKDSESSAESEKEENEEKSSLEATDDERESSRNDPGEAQFSDCDDAENTMSSFLGEADKSSLKQNSSRRKSIVVANESKLDETFQLDPKTSLSSSLHDSLHRSILRKSLNQSHKRRQTIDENTNGNGEAEEEEEEENTPSESEEEAKEKEDDLSEEEVKIEKKIHSEKGLSVSLNSIQIKKKKLKDTKAIRNSFTIGVSVRKNSSEDDDNDSLESETDDGNKNALVENDASSTENEDAALPNDDSSSSENKLLNESEEEVLEKVKNVHNVGPYKSRKSLSNSILLATPSDSDVKQKSKIKRTSLYLQEETASNSFVENLDEEKKKIKQRKRKSNSFCGVAAPLIDVENDANVQPRSEKKAKKSSELENKDVDNVKNVLSRCELMLEAANEAKRQAKLQAKKLKVKKPKLVDIEEKATKEEDVVDIPLVSKKEIKRKEKMKKELEKALKQSASVLTKAIKPSIRDKQKNDSLKLASSSINPTKRLESDFLESLMEMSNPNKKTTKVSETTPPSDKENSKKKSQKSKYRIENVHKKIESDIETLETACGTVIVEPSTPKKMRIQHGFRESPKTPVGFKVQNINSSEKKSNRKKSVNGYRKFKTASGAFIEEDLNKSKRKKRKLHIEEPVFTLPKTQWTRSGVFVEEDLSRARPLANSTATQFLVASLGSGKKNNPSSTVISANTLSKAMNFKQKALQNKNVPRTESREILNSKRRQFVNKQF